MNANPQISGTSQATLDQLCGDIAAELNRLTEMIHRLSDEHLQEVDASTGILADRLQILQCVLAEVQRLRNVVETQDL